MNRAEKRWVGIFALVLVGLTTLPYLFAYSHPGLQYEFTGFLFAVEDGNSYIAKMLSGAAGAWLFKSPYSAYPQSGVLVFFPYLLIGKLAAAPGLHAQLVGIYHLYRMLAAGLDVIATYLFISVFIQDIRLRRLGTALAIFGGGLGWLLVMFGQTNWLGSYPLEFYSPESFGFLEVYGLPHLAFARACLLIGLTIYLRAGADDQNRPGGWINRYWPFSVGFLFLITGILQPLTTCIGWGVIGVHQVILVGNEIWHERRGYADILRSHRSIAWIYLISSPIVLYTGIASFSDPYMQAWSTQNIIRSPHPLHYLVAYGLVIAFALIGIVRLSRSQFVRGSLLAGWAILFPFLAYFPSDLQRRFPDGIWVVWVVGLLAWMGGLAPRPQRLVRYGSGIVFLSTIFFMLGSLTPAISPGLPAYHPVDETRAYEYLAGIPERDAVVLTTYATGNALPAWAPVSVVIGHGPESIHLAELRGQVDRFFQRKTPDVEREKFIQTFHISYVFYGPNEKALGDWDPASAGYLSAIFKQGNYSIYQVTTNLEQP